MKPDLWFGIQSFQPILLPLEIDESTNRDEYNGKRSEWKRYENDPEIAQQFHHLLWHLELRLHPWSLQNFAV